MIYYKVIHFFITRHKEHFHWFNIGIYDCNEKANKAVEELKTKKGFSIRPNNFYIFKVLKLKKPALLNKTFWVDGFENYEW
ncbi:MAG: hypothetical protein E7522_04705 [Ruminococcaceae bacterium]|nr:hypothetical protein [Oscillospiraceae bacterium]